MARPLSPSLAVAERKDAETTIQSFSSSLSKKRKRTSVQDALQNAMMKLETLQNAKHVNEHALNEMAKQLKSVFEAQSRRQSKLRRDAVADVVARDASVIYSHPEDVDPLDPGFLRAVLRSRKQCEASKHLTMAELDDWSSEFFSFYTDMAQDFCSGLMYELILVVAENYRDLVPCILDQLADSDTLEHISDTTPLGKMLIPLFPKAIAWLHPVPCKSGIGCDCEANVLQRLAVVCSSPSDWEYEPFREAVAGRENPH